MHLPNPGPNIPRRGNLFTHNFGRLVLWLSGWRLRGELPDVRKAILIGAPHTTNWDAVAGLAAKVAVGLEAHWMGKHSLFNKPVLGWWLRLLGGLPIRRHVAHGVVQASIEEFNQREQLFLLVTPEGTRGETTAWKTGFYHMAAGAGVPIQMCSLFPDQKILELGPLLEPSGDIVTDWEKLRDYYAPVLERCGRRFPELVQSVPNTSAAARSPDSIAPSR